MKTLISILTLVFSLSTYGQSGNKSLLNFDGYYETTCYVEKGHDEGSQDYLRFYKNGKVINVGTDCKRTTSDLKDWYNINAEQVGKGVYRLKGKRCFFSIKSKSGIINYNGRIRKDGQINLKCKSLVIGRRGHDKYKFIPVSGLT